DRRPRGRDLLLRDSSMGGGTRPGWSSTRRSERYRAGPRKRAWDTGPHGGPAGPRGRGTVTATDEALDMARVAVAAAADKKAQDIVVLDVSEQLVITDCFVIASAPNERLVQAIVDEVEEKLRLHGAKPTRREGTREGRWVLLDFVDVVVHV